MTLPTPNGCVIEQRAARRDLADDEEVEAVFSRYRNA